MYGILDVRFMASVGAAVRIVQDPAADRVEDASAALLDHRANEAAHHLERAEELTPNDVSQSESLVCRVVTRPSGGKRSR